MKVRKEVTVAVIIGLALGLLAVGGVIRARQAFDDIRKSNTNNSSTNETANTPVNVPTGLYLTIETPDDSVSKSPTLTVNGKTLPHTYIAINGEKSEYLIVPDDLGSFSQDVTLVKGANTITITVYQDDGTKVQKTMNAVYTNAEI